MSYDSIQFSLLIMKILSVHKFYLLFIYLNIFNFTKIYITLFCFFEVKKKRIYLKYN